MCELNPNATDGICYAPGYAPDDCSNPPQEEELNYCPVSDDNYAEAEKLLEKPPQPVTGKAFANVGMSASGTANVGTSKASDSDDDVTDYFRGAGYILLGIALFIGGS